MEQDAASRRQLFASAPSRTDEASLLDCLFSMPDDNTVRRITRQQKAEGARLEARLAAEMRALIAARLRSAAG